jgi:hypothetical protein
MWLARLEAVLIEACAEIGQQKRIATTVQTAKVIGPTHASNFHPYADGEAA